MMTEEQIAARLRELDAEDEVLFERLRARFPVEMEALHDAGLDLIRRNGIHGSNPSTAHGGSR